MAEIDIPLNPGNSFVVGGNTYLGNQNYAIIIRSVPWSKCWKARFLDYSYSPVVGQPDVKAEIFYYDYNKI